MMLLQRHNHACCSGGAATAARRSSSAARLALSFSRQPSSHLSSSCSSRHNPCARTISASRNSRRRLSPVAYLPTDNSSGSSSESTTTKLRVLVVGANPAGLAAAVSLAQRVPGCAVEVHDSRPDPRQNADGGSLVALGKRGLEALSHIHTPPNSRDSSATSSLPDAPQQAAGLWTPGSASLGVLQGSAGTQPNPHEVPGLILLQDMVVAGPQGVRNEQYSRPASRSKAQQGSSSGSAGTAVTPGIAAIDELSLTSHLLSAAAALASQSATAAAAQQPQLVVAGGGGGGGGGGSLKPKGTTPIPQGPTSAPSAEAAQEAALPPTVPAPGTADAPAVDVASDSDSGGVQVHYGSHLTLLDAANKQATFMGSGGQASIVCYDLCIAADAEGGGGLVASALHGLADRKAAHKHPSAHKHATGSQQYPVAAEQEYKAWHDMPNAPQLTALLGGTTSTGSSSSDTTSAPPQGHLLVWTGSGAPQTTHPDLSSAAAAGSGTAIIPGAPSCTVMAWPKNKGGDTWSGCVFTDPQVFEALRSQSDYETFLGSLSAPAGPQAGAGRVKLPHQWLQGIAAQLKQNTTVGRVPAPVSAPPHSLAAPSAGLVVLTTTAAPAQIPQLLSPGVSLGLSEGAVLAAHVAKSMAGSAGGKAATAKEAVEQSLRDFNTQCGPEATALHKLTAQLSWLRHPFSPAAHAAAASVPWGSLAWIGAVLGAPRSGLSLQWKCLAAVLPLVAAVQRVVLYKLGLGRPEAVEGADSNKGRSALDASYRKQAPGGVSTSLDSGVHLDSGVGAAAAQRATERAALSAATAAAAGAAQGSGYSLADVAEGVEPCGVSLLAFLHTTDMRATSVWRLLQAAPLIMAVLWGAFIWAAIQAVRWGVWAFRAWGWAQSGVA